MRKQYLIMVIFVLVAVLSVTAAQPPNTPPAIGEVTPEPDSGNLLDRSDNPTYVALENTEIPIRDRVDLARRINGVTDIEPTPDAPPQWQLGDRQTFWASNLDSSVFQVEAELRAIGEHIYIWVEVGGRVSDNAVRNIAESFDTLVYDQVRELWGSEALPGIDNDPRIYALMAHNLGSGTAAYFASDHSLPSEIVPNSNEHEMFFINLDAGAFVTNGQSAISVLAHEFQHMIRNNIDTNEHSWLDEGFSAFTEVYAIYQGDTSYANYYLSAPYTQLNTWTELGNTAPHYGGSALFVSYFFQRYGLEGLNAWSTEPLDGLPGLNHVLLEMGEPGVDEFFADWAVANYIQDSAYAPIHGYDFYNDRQLQQPYLEGRTTSLPYEAQDSAAQYSTHYYRIEELNGVSLLDISFEIPPTVRLINLDSPTQTPIWYSNRADNSDTRLTRAFDLRNTSEATLNYTFWYHIEEGWDYGYVMISTDGGETWTLLNSAYTTTSNPYQKAYGPGYTGQSGGWIEERISLNDYVGQEVLIRFEMITDDAVNQPGMALDSLSIPEIGYEDDFSGDVADWQTEGWILTDNILPQRAWVQAISYNGGHASVTRWLAPATPDGGTAQWHLPLEAGTDEVVIVISPFAPTTTEPAPYTLSVSRR